MSAEVNLKTLCSALGFTAVAIVGGKLNPKGRAERARHIAGLIEEFCLEAGGEPTATAQGDSNVGEGISEAAARMADTIAKRKRAGVDTLSRDLIAYGFTADEIERHWALASALAAAMTKSTDA
jgi:hypothetical protein